MTTEQITKCLTELGEAPGAWSTFEGKLSHIGIQCDNILAVIPKTTQYYFDNDYELLLVRHTYGNPKKIGGSDVIPDGYISISHNGNPYIVQLEKGGCDDPTIGRFHEAISYEIITGLFAQQFSNTIGGGVLDNAPSLEKMTSIEDFDNYTLEKIDSRGL